MGNIGALEFALPVLWILLAMAVPFAIIVLLFRFVRAYEGRSASTRAIDERLARLEERVARIDDRLSSR
jgi:hypothetical protein